MNWLTGNTFTIVKDCLIQHLEFFTSNEECISTMPIIFWRMLFICLKKILIKLLLLIINSTLWIKLLLLYAEENRSTINFLKRICNMIQNWYLKALPKLIDFLLENNDERWSFDSRFWNLNWRYRFWTFKKCARKV